MKNLASRYCLFLLTALFCFSQTILAEAPGSNSSDFVAVAPAPAEPNSNAGGPIFNYPEQCGYASGGQCGGPCPEGKFCREVTVQARQDGRPRPDQAEPGVGTNPVKRCECGSVKENLCKDCSPESGLQCEGPCPPNSQGEGRVCAERQLGNGSVCQCLSNINTCQVGAVNGQVGCTGACSNGGCVLKDAGEATERCECGNTCTTGVRDDGTVGCFGQCQNGGLCVLDQDGKNCGCAVPSDCRVVTAEDYSSVALGGSCSGIIDGSACQAAFEDCVEQLQAQCAGLEGELGEPEQVGDCRREDGGIETPIGTIPGLDKCYTRCKATCCTTRG